MVDRARQILGSEVYIHQSRVNFKPGFDGKEFYWHSDFETWHAEDGMPRIRAVSISISLTDNYSFNGPLMIMPGSHRTYVSCVGETPDENYKSSLVQQIAGTPDQAALSALAERHGIDVLAGAAQWGDDVRLQLHARLQRQHHAVPEVERLHRLQQRGEHLRGAVRRGAAPTAVRGCA